MTIQDRTTGPVRGTILIHRAEFGDWYWRAIARNGKTIADSGEGYRNHKDILKAVDRLFSTEWLPDYSERDRDCIKPWLLTENPNTAMLHNAGVIGEIR